MGRTAVLTVGALGVALMLLASSGLASTGEGPRVRSVASTAHRLSAGGEPTAVVARRRHRPGCGASCRQLGIPQGTGGMTYCGAPPLSNTASVGASKILTIPGYTEFSPIVPGDLLVAAVASSGGAVAPPSGWTAVPNADQFDGSNARLQVFYAIPVPLNASSKVLPSPTYSFTSSSPQAMTGTLTNFTGVSQSDPIDVSSGQANPNASTSVTAPSITPTVSNTVLDFIGATGAQETWTVPPGMKTSRLSMPPSTPGTELEVATQRWPTATATADRTATISGPSESVAELIALTYPAPITCPHIRILNPSGTFFESGRRSRGPILRASAGGLISVRLHCDWTARCVGAFVAFDQMLGRVAASDIALPAGQTRAVQVAATPHGQRELRRLHRVPLLIAVGADLSNGQIVDAGPVARVGELELK